MKGRKENACCRRALDEAQRSLITKDIIDYADSMAHRYRGLGLDLDDLRQEARYGVCQAVLHFDAGRRVALKTFATYYIRKYTIKAIEEVGSIIRLRRRERAGTRMLSLDREAAWGDNRHGEASGIAETIADEAACETESYGEREAMAAAALGVLNARERKAVGLILGLEGTALSVRQASRMLNVKPERMRTIFNKSLAKMEAAATTTGTSGETKTTNTRLNSEKHETV